MNTSIQNLYRCLSFHPAIFSRVQMQETVHLLIGTDAGNTANGLALMQAGVADFPLMREHISLESTDPFVLQAKIEQADVFMFLYAASTLNPPQVAGPPFLAPVRQTMIKHWQKSVIFKDYGSHLHEAFAESFELIAHRNARLIAHASQSDFVQYIDPHGDILTGVLDPYRAWTSLDGHGNEDLVPGEISTHIADLSGQISFSGTFLGTVPFARKYGVVRDFMTVAFDEGKLIRFECENGDFHRDFTRYLDYNAGNRTVSEFGIGTNLGVAELYGLNASFEERHPGLHLALGGGEHGSHHMDLIFNGGKLAFNRDVFFNNGLFI